MTTHWENSASFSVVIPAKDEASVIGRCLAFVHALSPGEAEVVVVANGCSDETVARASEVPGVQVLDLPEGGKHVALNAGDAVVTQFPRVYLDADIVVSAEALRRLAELLDRDPAPAVAAPRPEFVTKDRPLPVRQFFSVFQQLPYVTAGLVGLGVYALNAEGRARFGSFPPFTADDLFVQRLFSAAEVRTLPDVTFQIQTPRTLADLVKVRTRVTYGNAELAASAGQGTERSSADTAWALLRLAARRPRLLPSTAVYLGITVASRVRAIRAAGTWHRDTSTR